jgi:hypothetical protein
VLAASFEEHAKSQTASHFRPDKSNVINSFKLSLDLNNRALQEIESRLDRFY